MIINIDTSGNIRVGGDVSTTSAKHFAIYLAALTDHVSEVSYDETSPIKNALYDPETGVLSWSENGTDQTYSMNTPDLDVFTRASFEYEGSVSPVDLNPLTQLVQEANSKIDVIQSALNSDLVGLFNTLTQHFGAVDNSIATQTDAIQASIQSAVDSINTDQKIVEVGAKVDAVQASTDLNYGYLTDRLIEQANQIYSTMTHIDTSIDDAKTALEAKVDDIQAGTDLSGEVAKLTWLAARCQMQRLDVLASLSLSKKKLDDYTVKAPEIRPDRMPTNETVNTFILSH